MNRFFSLVFNLILNLIFITSLMFVTYSCSKQGDKKIHNDGVPHNLSQGEEALAQKDDTFKCLEKETNFINGNSVNLSFSLYSEIMGNAIVKCHAKHDAIKDYTHYLRKEKPQILNLNKI